MLIKKNGFSLMELILVIAILGILIATIVSLNGQKETSKITSSQKIISQISNAATSWGSKRSKETFEGISMSQLKKTELPPSFNVEKANPWGGEIDIKVSGYKGNEINHYTITFTNVPYESCTSLINSFYDRCFKKPECVLQGNAYTFSASF